MFDACIKENGKCYCKVGQGWCMDYKECQVLLQSGTTLVYLLQRRATAITKWDRFDACIKKKCKPYCKVGKFGASIRNKSKCY